MDPVTFSRLKEDLHRNHFKDEKFEVLRSNISSTYTYISVEQVAELVRDFSFDDDKLNVVQICVPKLSPSTCCQVVSLVSLFSFDGNKVKVVEAIAQVIVDPANHHELDRAITFNSDREKARNALLARQSMGPMPHHPPHHQYPPQHRHPSHHLPYPGHYPAGQVPPPSYPSAPGYVPYPGAPHSAAPGGNPFHSAAGFLNAAAHAAVDGVTRPFGPPPHHRHGYTHHDHAHHGVPRHTPPGYPHYYH